MYLHKNIQSQEMGFLFSIFQQDLVSHFWENFNTYYVCIMVRIRGGGRQEFVLQYYIEPYGFLTQSYSCMCAFLHNLLSYFIFYFRKPIIVHKMALQEGLFCNSKNLNSLSLTPPPKKENPSKNVKNQPYPNIPPIFPH